MGASLEPQAPHSAPSQAKLSSVRRTARSREQAGRFLVAYEKGIQDFWGGDRSHESAPSGQGGHGSEAYTKEQTLSNLPLDPPINRYQQDYPILL